MQILGPITCLGSSIGFRTGVAQDDPRYAAFVSGFDPFARGDFSAFTRHEDIGANPWHVALIPATLVVLVLLVVRQRYELRGTLLLAGGLCACFLLFVATTRYQRFGVRLTLPLLVAWSVPTAMALTRVHRHVGRIVIGLLVVACLPQLLDNRMRSLMHPAFQSETPLGAYFPLEYSLADFVRASDYEALAEAVSQSGCDRLAFGNSVILEYPVWLALDQVGWQGVIDSISIEDVPFPNPSRRLQRVGFEPCSTLRRVDLNAVTTDISKINLRWNVLMASFEPALAPRLSASAPFVDNTVEGLRVLPGGGWSALIAGTSAAFAGNEATLFLYSQHPLHVTLRFDGAPGVVTVVAQPPDGEVGMPAKAQPGASLDVRVPAGITELRLHLAGADTLPATESVPIHVAVSRAG